VTDLHLLDATAQAELVAKGEVEPSDLIEAAIARIEKVDQEVNAVPVRMFERALRDAPALPEGPFRGVPTVVKDTVPTKGDPWYFAMTPLRDLDHHATWEAHVVSQMRRAGMAVIGKASAPELEGGISTEPAAFGECRNPWDLTKTVGGSSGGSAAAVAAGLVPVSLGVDGGGSIRIPSSICGVVGLKPTRGRTSLHPCFVGNGASTAGPIARSVRDVARALDAISGVPHGDHWVAPAPARPFADEVGADPGRLRIGLWTAVPGGATAHDECVAAVEDIAKLLESAGHVIERSHPQQIDESFLRTPEFGAYVASHLAYFASQVEAEIGRSLTEDEVETVTWECMVGAQQIPATLLLHALTLEKRHSVEYASWWDQGFDLLLTPTIAVLPFPLGETKPKPDAAMPDFAAYVPFTPHVNIAGLPAITLPTHWSTDGLPIGTQLVAAYGREDQLFRVASQIEAAKPWADRRPPI
jgi:amidase